MRDHRHVREHARPACSFVSADPLKNPEQQADSKGGCTGNDLILSERGNKCANGKQAARGEVPAAIRKSVELWIGCIAGALEESEYRAKLARAGFESVEIEPTRVYRVDDAREFLAQAGIDADAIAPQVDGKFMSAFVRAVKPAVKAACCGPSCCA